MLTKILAKQPFSSLSSDPAVRAWIARTIAGAVVSDGRIEAGERHFLTTLLDALKSDPDTREAMLEVVRAGKPPVLRPVSLDPAEARRVFRFVMELCVCDNDLDASELRYLQNAGRALGLAPEMLAESFRSAILRTRGDFFNEVLSELEPLERQWFAGAILKVVYADGRVDRGEVSYLGNVHELLEDNPPLLDAVKSSPRDFSVKLLPEVYFDDRLGRRLLKFLVEITMADGSLDAREEATLKELALQTKFPAEDIDHLIEALQAWHDQLRAG